ncbi:unnamed protein product [Ectocarpus sp. CCAP 1310/34]|nr:unnamed protein product [Ectocarpus sp. CCAP 1310/34]
MAAMVPLDDQIFNAVGTTGGIILACALVPQIVLAHKRRSAEDISYMWQAIYVTGLATLMIYYVHFGLWAVFFPVAVECSCLIYLTALKMYFEKFASGDGISEKLTPSSHVVGEGTGINSARDAGRSPQIGRYGAAGCASSPEISLRA